MSPSRLLRISDFCQQRTERKVQVKLEILSSIPRRRRRRSPSSKIFDEESTVYVSADLLVALSVQIGDIVWLSCSSDSLKGVPVVLHVANECGSCNTEFVVEAPPVIAASIGAKNGRDCCYLRTCNDELSEAHTVKVRPLGRPIPPSWIDFPNAVPSLTSTSKTRLLAQSSLISVFDETRGLLVYEVVDTESDERHVEAALATNKTKWSLEPAPSKCCMRRLPILSMAVSFHKSIRLKEDEKFDEDFKSRRSSIEAKALPHPSISEMVNALSIQPNSPGPQRVLHVEGTEENHVGRCIESAANTLGMRYLSIHGLAAHAHASGIPVSTGSHVDQLAGLKAALQHAQECAPCVLHLSDIDQEWSQDDEPMRHMQQQRLWTALMDALVVQLYDTDNIDFLHKYVPSIIVVVSTTKPLSAGPLLQSLVFESLVIRPPDETYARYIWNDDQTFDDLFSSHLEGRSARDISHLYRYWKHCASNPNKMDAFNVFCAQLDTKQRKSTPHIPSVHWHDVGGMANVRSEIIGAIELPLQHPNLFPNGGRSGILLYGPPGTGKTFIAKAVATECGLPFLSVKGPELLGSYVGESEANVRATFAAARKAATQGRKTAASILFFDELDSLAPRRGHAGDNGGVMDRVVATLLAELDGSPSADGTVVVIGATNRPDLLDPSLLRPGRLDRLVYLGMASTAQDRAQILAAQIRKFRLEADNPIELARQVVDRLPPNLTGADFSAISSGAMRMSLERLCNDAENELKKRQTVESHLTLDNVLDEWEDDRLKPVVTADDLVEASKCVVPSVSAKQLADYERLRLQFSST